MDSDGSASFLPFAFTGSVIGVAVMPVPWQNSQAQARLYGENDLASSVAIDSAVFALACFLSFMFLQQGCVL